MDARTAGTHGNSIGVSICSSANNYSQNAVTTTSAEEAEGQTIISVTDASVFSVGDLVNFGETDGFEYEVTSVNDSGSSDTIVIKLKDNVNGEGLQAQSQVEQTYEEDGGSMTCLMVLRHFNICK